MASLIFEGHQSKVNELSGLEYIHTQRSIDGTEIIGFYFISKGNIIEGIEARE